MKSIRILLLLLCGFAALPAQAEDERPLTIATREAPPFAMKNSQDEWHGISIRLWREIAAQMGVKFQFKEMSLVDMLSALEKGEVDAAVAALTITSEREKAIDFSYPFMSSGLGKAVVKRDGNTFLLLLKRVISFEFLSIVLALLSLLVLVGAAVWLFERGRNDQFSKKPLEGIGSGFWWSAVTMTTVGYGDKAPATLGGRIIGLVWMFTGIILISSFTAAFTTILTVGQLSADYKSGLEGMNITTVAASTAEAYLQQNYFNPHTEENLSAALKQLQQGETDVVVYDIPILRYMVKKHFNDDLVVLPETFEQQNYGIGLPPNSPHREAINLALLEYTSSAAWQELLLEYLGR